MKDSTGDVKTNPREEGAEGVISEPTSDVNQGTNQDVLDRILLLLTQTQGSIDVIQKNFFDKLQYDTAKEKAFDKLYDELKFYKDQSSIIDSLMKPLLLDLLLFHDDIKRFLGAAEIESIDSDTLTKELRFIYEGLVEVLYRQEIIPIDRTDTFDPSRHRTVKSVSTTAPEENFQISNVLRDGFYWRDKILRPADVEVKRLDIQSEAVKK